MRKVAILIGLLGVILMTEGFRREVQAAGTTPGPSKIGFVDLQKTLEKTKKGAAAKAKLEGEKAKKQKEIDKQKKDLEAAAKDLEKKRDVLKPDALAAQARKLEEDYVQLQQRFATFQQELLKSEATLTREIFKAAKAHIEAIARRDGYTMIVEKNEGAVLYADPAVDITDEVNKKMDGGK